MKKISNRSAKLIFLFLLLTYIIYGQSRKVLTEADYDQAVSMFHGNTNKLVDHLISPEWLPDGRLWYRDLTENNSEFKIFNPADCKMITAASKEELFEKASVKLPEHQRSDDEVISPDEKYAVFIRNWNLWLKDIASGTEKPLTTDGIKDFGYATDNAGWTHSDKPIVSWSPDSKKIATFQQDQRNVNDMYLVKTKVGAPDLEQWKYPFVGDSVIFQIHRLVINISTTQKVVRFKMEPDLRRATLWDDISWEGTLADVDWSEDSNHLAFVSTSRDHKQAKVRIADCKTGEVKDIFEEKVDTQYESGQDAICWRYLSATNEIIWYSERSNWGHLYLYDATSGKLKNQITSGNYVVREVKNVDLKNRVIFFIASGNEAGSNPYYRYLYRVNFDGTNLQLLTSDEGDHSISFSPDHTYFIDSYSQSYVPSVYVVRDKNGKLITTLEKTDISRLEATGWKPCRPFTVKSANNEFDLYGFWYEPTHLDTQKKYPVIVHIYPGPSGSINNWGFSTDGSLQALAELGFVVVQLEGSCNPYRSKTFHDTCYGNMGENTLPDQIAALKQLAKKYPFFDLEKVGIWGHSGGGFAAAAAIFKYPDFFKVAVSLSGNHDNRNYEDDWGERYIGLETLNSDSISNYEMQANQIFAKNLKGKLLLVHGGMDENVPPYNSYLVADALIKENKDFDFILLPNARHVYGENRLYIIRRTWDYFVQHLLHKTPPKEYVIKIEPDPRIKDNE
jgi:dipeptidyl-peptidase-4